MSSEIDLIRVVSGKNRSALRLAERAHRGVTRKTDPDVPYILHPVAVAEALAAAGADRNLVCAGCLHDVVEDTDVTLDEIEAEFGATVRHLVDAVTKTPQTKALPLEEQAEHVWERCARAGIDAVALKAADLLVNVTDLVLDNEDLSDPAQGFRDLFGADRADGKLDHYLSLAELLVAELADSRYERLGDALRSRCAELRDLRA